MKINIINTLILAVFFSLIASCSKQNTDTSRNGTSGSLARMIVLDNYMYVINNSELTTFDISTPSTPLETDKIEIEFGIETLFPFANYLFIGSNSGLFIYDITNPAKPVAASESKVEHFTACDPVVANANFAYVTLNSLRTDCGNTVEVNRMEIVDIQNIRYPKVVNSIEMSGPKGLGIDGNHLFVCEKNLGVIIYELSNPSFPNAIDTLTGFVANDLIPDNGNLMVVCDDGLRQFNYTDINNISLISFLDTND